MSPGFNIFAGQNNSGKSALLRALSLSIEDNPHRSPEAYRGADLPTSRLDFSISIEPTELVRRLNLAGVKAFFPMPDNSTNSIKRLESLFESNREVSLCLVKHSGQPVQRRGNSSLEGFGGNPNTTGRLAELSGNRVVLKQVSSSETLALVMVNVVDEPIFYFSPQRLNIGRQKFSTETKLNSDASNLPSVLAYLQGSRGAIFERIERHLVSLMPGVERISVTPSDDKDFEILVWPQKDTSRSELSFSLTSSGTGVGQLLAILTAVVTVDQAIIIIDEINTFLHPTASKGLISLLRSEYPQHQYIISTHSSDVLSSAVSDRVFLVRREGFVSEVESVDLGDFSTSREVAGHLGFSMMDVFGHDRLLWVEGQTEELVFPYLFRHLGIDTSGIGVVAVASTAEFSQRGASRKSIISLYDKVAKSSAPLLKGMAFGLDREDLSDDAVKSLERSKRKLRFLPRRCLESFLLSPSIIAQLLDALGEKGADEAAVEAWMMQHGGDADFSAATLWRGRIDDAGWLKRVDSAKLLARMFLELTDARHEYRKTTHTLDLFKLALDREPELLADFIDFAKFLLEVARRDTSP